MISNIRKYKLLFVSMLILAFVSSCNDFLEVKSLTKISSEQLLSNEKGMKTLLANVYNGIPMEDFCFRPNAGFNRRGWQGGIGEMIDPSFYTDEALKSDGGEAIGPGSLNVWSGSSSNGFNAWHRNREINIFMKSIETTKNDGIITEDRYNRLKSEGHFARAYLYFALAKRFGGVPIIDWLQDDDYSGDPAPLFIPRDTELNTWKFVLSECDKAIEYLPTPETFTSEDGDPRYRATKWAAYALKSRAALHAASLAKYGNRVSYSGRAVDLKLVGMESSEASFFYNECISASKAIIDNSNHSLYRPTPANPTEAATNYQYLFLNLPDQEVIFGRTYQDGSVYDDQGHGFDSYFAPSQARTGFHKWGRFSVTLDIVDLYEDYTDDGTGGSAKIKTRTDGIEDSHFDTNTPTTAQVGAIPFIKYDNPFEPFKNKDARLHGSVIVPGADYKGIKIIMQGGMIGKDGSLRIYEGGSETGLDGETYYSYGEESPGLYSGFATMTSIDDANFSCSGFTVRKFLAENQNPVGADRSSSTAWIDFRLAEVYLNYAEAVVESGVGDQALAARLINDLRKRAAHKDEIPLTLENVMKERRIEMAFEHNRIWDLWRRREYHTVFDNYRRKSLVQLIDLRENPAKYVFLRMNNFQDVRAGGRTFQTINYYWNIPGTDVSGIVNNPGRE